MGHIQRAVTVEKRCPLTEDVCVNTVAQHIASFLPQPYTVEQAIKLIEEKCGRYTKGKHAGKLRGWAYMTVCVTGGWKVLGPGAGNGMVMFPGKVYDVVIRDFNGNPYLEACYR